MGLKKVWPPVDEAGGHLWSGGTGWTDPTVSKSRKEMQGGRMMMEQTKGEWCDGPSLFDGPGMRYRDPEIIERLETEFADDDYADARAGVRVVLVAMAAKEADRRSVPRGTSGEPGRRCQACELGECERCTGSTTLGVRVCACTCESARRAQRLEKAGRE